MWLITNNARDIEITTICQEFFLRTVNRNITLNYIGRTDEKIHRTKKLNPKSV